MDRYDFFFLQAVTEAQVDDAFTRVEEAIDRILPDAGLVGVLSGMAVTQHAGTPNLTVDVTAGTTADADGQRIRFGSTQNPTLATDHLGASTAVSTTGKTKIVSLFVMFDRALSDLQLDGNSDPVYYVRGESFAWHVVQGAESSGTPTPPALDPDMILLADVTLSFGQTQILNANIATTGTARRQDAIVVAGTPVAVRRGHVVDAISDIVGAINSGLTGNASSINYAGGGTWADGTTNPATNAEAQFDKIITDLAVSAASASSGAARVGMQTNLGGALNGLTTVLAALSAINTNGGFKNATNTWASTQTFSVAQALTAASTFPTPLTLTRAMRNIPAQALQSSDPLTADGAMSGTGIPGQLSTNVSGTENYGLWMIELPNGATITNIDFWFDPPGGHGSVPGVGSRTRMTLTWRKETDGTTGSSTTVEDSGANVASVGAYEARHKISMTGSFGTGTNPIDNTTKIYYLYVLSDKGGSAVAPVVYDPPIVTFTELIKVLGQYGLPGVVIAGLLVYNYKQDGRLAKLQEELANEREQHREDVSAEKDARIADAKGYNALAIEMHAKVLEATRTLAEITRRGRL